MADKPTSVVAAICLGCVGVFAIMAQPILVEVLVARLGLERSAAGGITAVEALGTALGPVLAMLWMQRLPWRLAAIGALLVVIAGNVVSATLTGTTALMATRFLVGLLGEGTAFALAIAIVGGTAQKDRNFALLIAAQVALGVAFFLALPMPRDAGVSGVMFPLAALAAASLLTVGWIPAPQAGAHGHGGHAPAGGSSAPAFGALAVMLVWCTGLGAVWAFVKLIGVEVTCPGCDEPAKAAAAVAVGQALGLSTGLAVVGALAAAALADRVGRIPPVAVALTVQLVMVLLLQGEMSWVRFAATAATFQAFWNLTGPYMMGTIALGDGTGRVSLLIPTAQIGGFFLGPTIAGAFMGPGQGLGTVNAVAAACIALALLLFVPVARRVQAAAARPR
jgi:predicted MFS family arabinose efflux permease